MSMSHCGPPTIRYMTSAYARRHFFLVQQNFIHVYSFVCLGMSRVGTEYGAAHAKGTKLTLQGCQVILPSGGAARRQVPWVSLHRRRALLQRVGITGVRNTVRCISLAVQFYFVHLHVRFLHAFWVPFPPDSCHASTRRFDAIATWMGAAIFGEVCHLNLRRMVLRPTRRLRVEHKTTIKRALHYTICLSIITPMLMTAIVISFLLAEEDRAELVAAFTMSEICTASSLVGARIKTWK